MNRKPFKFAISDHVRSSRDKGVFAKGYVQSWSEYNFVIDLMRDLSGETLQGIFHQEQLQRVKPPNVFSISRIIRQ